ncbi:MAG: hypothetical protein MHPSP_003988, partial [Paramarteilia canceri]
NKCFIYDLLEVNANASMEELKTAWKKKVREYAKKGGMTEELIKAKAVVEDQEKLKFCEMNDGKFDHSAFENRHS